MILNALIVIQFPEGYQEKEAAKEKEKQEKKAKGGKGKRKRIDSDSSGEACKHFCKICKLLT